MDLEGKILDMPGLDLGAGLDFEDVQLATAGGQDDVAPYLGVIDSEGGIEDRGSLALAEYLAGLLRRLVGVFGVHCPAVWKTLAGQCQQLFAGLQQGLPSNRGLWDLVWPVVLAIQALGALHAGRKKALVDSSVCLHG